MLFDLRHVRGEREHIQKTFEPTTFDAADEEYRVTAPVRLSMNVIKAEPDVYRVSGGVTTRLELECSRCVEAFELPLEATFELRYVPDVAQTATASGKTTDEDREIGEDDLTIAFYQDSAIDLVQLLREQFQLALPMKPLCTEGCRGLCVVCGVNQNRSTCACHPVWEDPRLAALKGLLNRHKEN